MQEMVEIEGHALILEIIVGRYDSFKSIETHSKKLKVAYTKKSQSLGKPENTRLEKHNKFDLTGMLKY